jgi:putative ABC transport system substrate-binding protein
MREIKRQVQEGGMQQGRFRRGSRPTLRRRDFIAAMCGGAVARPLASFAQQKAMPVIGVLTAERYKQSFEQEMHNLGHDEGKTVHLEYRPVSPADAIPRFVAELVDLKVDTIVAFGSQAAQAAREATQTIPIVMISSDPVGIGLVTSLARPGGNVTGLSLSNPEVSGKRLQLLKEATASLSRLAALWDPNDPPAAISLKETEAAGRVLGVEVHAVEAQRPENFGSAFAAATEADPEAIVIIPGVMMSAHVRELAALALQYRLPSIYWQKAYTAAGGLMSYGPDVETIVRRSADYVDKILRGERPANLPIEQPTYFEFVVNLKTAKTLGLAVSRSLLGLADEVIE